jgi:4-hydroxy-2-oxoheptanedioate aldolase
MQNTGNPFKQALSEGREQIGLWCSLCSNLAAEVIAGSGFDWLLIDMEHAPTELTTLVGQLQGMMGGTATPVVRPSWNDPVQIKRILDAGANSLLVPYIQNADEARAAVAATRYPPEGIRGVASIHRGNRFARDKSYAQHANSDMCILAQIETTVALDNLEAIAAVDGIDALFIGPSDLAASLGHVGNNNHPDVRAVIEKTITRIKATGKPAAILTAIEADAKHWIECGCTVVAVGSDISVLAKQTEALAARFKPAPTK